MRYTHYCLLLLNLLTIIHCSASEGSNLPVETFNLSRNKPENSQLVHSFQIGFEEKETYVWGRGNELPRIYFAEFLPSFFERILFIEDMDLNNNSMEWIFTGNYGGFTVSVDQSTVRVVQRYYDSFGLNEFNDGKINAEGHPEKIWMESQKSYKNLPKSIKVAFDHKLGLIIYLDGKEIIRQLCLFDVTQHQLRIANKNYRTRNPVDVVDDLAQHQLKIANNNGRIKGYLFKPEAREVFVSLKPDQKYQSMIGFGGIGIPTAYAQLSQTGKREWWEKVCEYNLLIQREYPIGSKLNPEMDNWENLNDATPIYYGDSFPAGEISNFDYIKTLKQLDGKVWFEFWTLPEWSTQDWRDAKGKLHRGVADPDIYVKAIIQYCEMLQKKTGASPNVIGIQNERSQPPEIWYEMTLTLRKELNRAGFDKVRIHMPDSLGLERGIERAKIFKNHPEVWNTIDYSATHMYDFQKYFTNPDGFDSLLCDWKKITDSKPFLSTELCINAPPYQLPTYRIAWLMGELYHKNLVLADASAICYCWTILNVIQPSYGWTRSLFVIDQTQNFTPKPSSFQLRVFGSFSRRIRKGMKRIQVESSSNNILVSAFDDASGRKTMILLNRSTVPYQVKIKNAHTEFQYMEKTNLYNENTLVQPPLMPDDEILTFSIDPGSIVTLSDYPIRKLPDNFYLDEN